MKPAFKLLMLMIALMAVMVFTVLVVATAARHGALRVQQAQVQKSKPVDKRPALCYHMYNVGAHSEWAKCMGVQYVAHTRKKRAD